MENQFAVVPYEGNGHDNEDLLPFLSGDSSLAMIPIQPGFMGIEKTKKLKIPKNMMYITGEKPDGSFAVGILAEFQSILAREIGMSFSPMVNEKLSPDGMIFEATMACQFPGKGATRQWGTASYTLNLHLKKQKRRNEKRDQILEKGGVEVQEWQRELWKAYGYKVEEKILDIPKRGGGIWKKKVLWVSTGTEPGQIDMKIEFNDEGGIKSFRLPAPIQTKIDDEILAKKQNIKTETETKLYRRMTERVSGIKLMSLRKDEVREIEGHKDEETGEYIKKQRIINAEPEVTIHYIEINPVDHKEQVQRAKPKQQQQEVLPKQKQQEPEYIDAEVTVIEEHEDENKTTVMPTNETAKTKDESKPKTKDEPKPSPSQEKKDDKPKTKEEKAMEKELQETKAKIKELCISLKWDENGWDKAKQFFTSIIGKDILSTAKLSELDKVWKAMKDDKVMAKFLGEEEVEALKEVEKVEEKTEPDKKEEPSEPKQDGPDIRCVWINDDGTKCGKTVPAEIADMSYDEFSAFYCLDHCNEMKLKNQGEPI